MTNSKSVNTNFERCCARVGVATALMALSLSASADTILGLHASAHLWQPDLGGTIGQEANPFDFDRDFSGDKENSTSILLAVEHPLPFIPNVQVRQTPLKWSGSAASASGTLRDQAVNSVSVNAEMDINTIDGTLYYEVLDNWVSLDLGLTARQFDGFVKVKETSLPLEEQLDLDMVLPMLYAHARFDLPFSGLAAGVRGNAVAYGDNNLVDAEAYLHLEMDFIPMFDFGIQGGLRSLTFSLDEGSWYSDAKLEGAYVSLTGHF